MGRSIQQSFGREVWALVKNQHGVVSRAQLSALGMSANAIEHRIATRRLHPLLREVYAVGRPEVTRHGRWMAAALACGADAFLSHRSAAELWGITPMNGSGTTPVHISLLGGYDRRRPGLVIHRRVALAPADVTAHLGIPVTAPACTIIDVALGLRRGQLEAAINEADKHGLVDPEELRAAVEPRDGRPGAAKVREVLDRATFTLTDSELERRFLPIARSAGLPRPKTQQWVNGFRVDFYWPELRLVVETDGLRYHRTPAQQAEDRRRDQAHTAAGLTPLRFTRAQIRFEPRHVRAILTATARRLQTIAESTPL